MSFSSNLKTIRTLASQLDTLEIHLLSGEVSLEVYVDCLALLSRMRLFKHALDEIIPVLRVEMGSSVLTEEEL